MPSLWSWLPRRKYQSEIPLDSSESNKKGRRPMKKLFSFGSKDKSRDASAGLRRHTVLNDDQDVYPHMAPKTQGIERAFQDDKDDGLKKLEDLLEGNNYPRRPLAYEIFDDPNKPKPRKLADENRPTFLSQPSLNYNYEPVHKPKEFYPPYHVQERNGYSDVEMRKKSPNIFAGLVSKAQRHSMQGDYPPQGRMQRMEPRRTESMYGYVPRAVSLHDASAVLFGQDKEEILPPKSQKLRMDNFAQRPAWNARISEDVSEMDSDFAPLMQNTPSRRERSVSHDAGMRRTELGNGFPTGNVMGREMSPPAQRNRQVNQMKQATGNDNFFFSSSFLNPTTNSSHLDSEIITSVNAAPTSDAHPKRKHRSSKNNHSNNNNNNNNHHLSNNNSKSIADTNNGFWLSKADILGNDRHNDRTNPGVSHKNQRNNNTDNESDVTSLLQHFDNLSGIDNAIRNDKQQLEGIFSTEGEVLY